MISTRSASPSVYRAVELQQDVDGAVEGRRVELRPADPLARRVVAQPVDGIDVQARDRVGVGRRDLLDLHAALRRQHAEVELRGAVERERRVVLLRDVAGLLDPEHADGMSLDVHAEDVAGMLPGLRRVGGELDASGLAPPADLHLRLHDDRVAETVGGGHRSVDGLDRLTG